MANLLVAKTVITHSANAELTLNNSKYISHLYIKMLAVNKTSSQELFSFLFKYNVP